LLQYHIKKEDVGKFVSFKCIPIRNDGTAGEPGVFIGKDRVTAGAHSPFLGNFPNRRSLYMSSKKLSG
jgi:hypothetical protein